MKLISNTARAGFFNTVLILAFSLIILVTETFAFHQTAPGIQPSLDFSQVLGILNTWVVILGILVTVLLGVTAFNILNQYREAKKYKTDLMRQMEKEIRDLKDKYKLSDLKTPDEILQTAQNRFEPAFKLVQDRMEELRQKIDGQSGEFKSNVERSNSDLRTSIEFILKTLSEHSSEIARIPSKDSILREVGEKYQSPSNLQQLVLRQVLDAFVRLKNVSSEEIESISGVLRVAQESTKVDGG